MIDLRKFIYRNAKWACSVEPLDDRLEYAWDDYGLGVDKGKKSFLRQELARTLSEYSGSRGMNGKRLLTSTPVGLNGSIINANGSTNHGALKKP
jgi:hypothetical protein